MSVLIFELSHAQATALLLTAGKNDVRCYLNGVCIDTTGKAPAAVSTDGHRLLAVKLGEATGDMPPGCYIIPRGALAAVKPAKVGRASMPLTLTIVSEEGAKPRVSIAGATTASAELIDGRYPDWRRTMPGAVSWKVAQFNAAYIFDFQRIAELLGGKFCKVAHNGDAGALIGLGVDDAVGVCMPMRNEDEPTVPDWV